jgi:cyclopropane fatty-acyl-phospholipid synthase-like methyltransferase
MGELVRAGYDALGRGFGEWACRIRDPTRERLIAALVSRLPERARVLDLGCGAGALARVLAERFEVVGVDLSQEQLALAREAVPRASFFEADFTTLELDEASVDAVCALYSITHVPREEHAALFERIARWLRPGGLFLASLSGRGSEDWTGEWLGVEMFFSGHDAETNRRLLREAGFELVHDEIATIEESEGPAQFLWVVASSSRRAA